MDKYEKAEWSHLLHATNLIWYNVKCGTLKCNDIIIEFKITNS